MNRMRIGISFVLTAMLAATAVAQRQLDPVFQITSVNGDCKISIPGQQAFMAAEEFKAYPYGSRVRTGMKSSLVITISEGNIVRVLANADVVMDENTTDTKIKNVRLNEGEVEIELNRTFYEGGNALNVETATAICGAVGTHFRVASRLEQDLRIVIFRVLRGLIRVYGENFEVAEMKADTWLSLLSPADRSFLRLKSEKGEFDVRVKNEDGTDRTLETKQGAVIQIWQREVPDTGERIITIVLTSPEGEMLESITVTLDEGQAPLFGEPGPHGWATEEDTGERKARGRDNPLPPDPIMDELIQGLMDDINVEYHQSPPTPPSPTPVGKR